MQLVIPIIEIVMIYLGLLTIYRFVRGSTGDSALKGVAIIIAAMLFGFWVISATLKLYRIELLIEGLLSYLLLGLVVIFQPELRRAVVKLGQNRLLGKFVGRKEDIVTLISQAVFRLARSKTGALIAMERGVGLNNYAERGTRIDALFSSELLDTIFFQGSPLHDGAVIIRGKRIVAGACLFPLTENVDASKRLGTRHRAALGISEESDAIAIVISEETGRVSIAVKGKLHRDLDREEFEEQLRGALLDEVAEPANTPQLEEMRA